MAADESDEPGVLGNLPRSRPGHRSDKRGAGTRAAATGSSGGAGGAAAGRARPAPKPKTRRRLEPEAPRPSEAGAHRSTDPVTGAVRLAGKAAEAGLRTAGALLRRLPGR